MKPTLFFAQNCPDTAPFIAELNRLGIEYEAVEILTNLANFKRFLVLRDQHHAFEQAKSNGYIGIPALQVGELVILDYEVLAELTK